VDQTIEERFGFGIDPVQIFDDEDERLALTLSRKSRRFRASSVRRRRGGPSRLSHSGHRSGHPAGEDCGYDAPQTFVEDDDFVVDLRAYLPHVIVVFNSQVRLSTSVTGR
jgi:hypothetical protein